MELFNRYAQLAFKIKKMEKLLGLTHCFHIKIGVSLFLIGLYINIDSDNRLIKLRTISSKSKSNYKIPRGGIFEYVSAANYFGECVEWSGFALASWSLPALAFSLFTWANIGPRAYHHHL
jgi:steroid 5-alpha reductase family enzyme